MLKTLVFAPHSDIWVHAFPEALAADALAKSGQRVVYVGCGRAFESYCVCMSARGLTEASAAEDKRAVCVSCERNERELRREFGFEGYQLAEVLTEDDRRRTDERVAQASPATLLSIEEDGIPIGRYAIYEYLLHKKKISLDLSPQEWRECAMHLRNALLALAGGKRIVAREAPDRVLAYNSLYSVNRVVCALGAASGALVYFLHAGLNLSRRLQALLIGRNSTLRFYAELTARWPQWENAPCDAQTLRLITEHFRVLFRGGSIFGYSARARGAAADLRRRFGAGPHQRIVVAAMSSYDELFAAETAGARGHSGPTLFPQQVDWIRSLLDFFRGRPDLFLVVRVHPREFPNRREGVKSEHAALLESAFAALPPNAQVNWPSDEVSLYDLADEAALFLTAWSSVGKEMSALGLPVVSYCPHLLLYPAALHETATTQAAYYAAIERALASGWSFERVRRTFRWLALEHQHGAFDIADGFGYRENGLVERVWRRLARMVHPGIERRLEGLQHRLAFMRRPGRLAQSAAIAHLVSSGGRTALELRQPAVGELADETRHLRHELGRIRRSLFGTAPCRSAQSLCARLDEAARMQAGA
jgi:hypothetical protein